MNTTETETRKRPVIDSINFSWTDNYVDFSDTDSQTDYFNGYSLGTQRMIEWVIRDGADTIKIDVTNNEDLPKYDKRAARLAKAAGYTVEKKTEKRWSQWGNLPNERNEWINISYILTKKV